VLKYIGETAGGSALRITDNHGDSALDYLEGATSAQDALSEPQPECLAYLKRLLAVRSDHPALLTALKVFTSGSLQ